MENIQQVHNILTIISSSIIILLGFILSVLRTLPFKTFNNFRKVRLYLALSYFILGLSGIIVSFLKIDHVSKIQLFLIISTVATFQSLLFTVVHMLLLQPEVLSTYKIRMHFLYVFLAYLVVFVINHLHFMPTYIPVIMVIILYVLLQVSYIRSFNELYHKKLKFKDVYYTRAQSIRLRIIFVSFYTSFTIGLFSLAIPVFGLRYFIIFKVVYTLYYVYLVVLLFNKLSPIISMPGIINLYHNTNGNISTADYTSAVTSLPAVEEKIPDKETEKIKENLKIWIQDKGFTKGDMSVEDVADTLKTSNTSLRKYFRDNIHCDFRTWRMELRIEEAKKLLITNPEYSISEISEMVGFNNRSNFFTQFTKITGITPKEWRENNNTQKSRH